MDILLTGSNGFLGKIIKSELNHNKIIGLSRSGSADIFCDLSKQVPIIPAVDVVIHAAGAAHFVPKNKKESDVFFDTNVTGTENLLSAISSSSKFPKSFVFISTVAVYGRDSGQLISEQSPLEATDPYGLSKIRAEEIVSNWCNVHKVKCIILRLPLIIGNNPLGNLKTMINGIKKGFYFNIRGGAVRKSMVLASDVAQILPKLFDTEGIYNLTDGHHPSFKELSQLLSKQLGKSNPKNIPGWLAVIIARIGDLIGTKSPISSDKLQKILSELTFDDSKARMHLGWNPTRVLNGFTLTKGDILSVNDNRTAG